MTDKQKQKKPIGGSILASIPSPPPRPTPRWRTVLDAARAAQPPAPSQRTVLDALKRSRK